LQIARECEAQTTITKIIKIKIGKAKTGKAKTGEIKTRKAKVGKSPAKRKRGRPAKYIVEEAELEIKTEIIDNFSSDLEVELENHAEKAKAGKTKIEKSLIKHTRRRPAKRIIEEAELETKTKIINCDGSRALISYML
jgi:hypothetical protein